MTDSPTTPDTPRPVDTPHFETSDVEANLAIEQGLGVGERELEAQREAGGIVTPDEDETGEDDPVQPDTGDQEVPDHQFPEIPVIR